MKAFLILLAAAVFVPVLARASEPAAPKAAAGLVRAAPVLKPAVTVEGDLIRLGDLFDNVEKGADVPVAYAPKPGRQVVLELDQLWSIARAQRLQWRPRSRFERIVVSRASRTIGGKEIKAEVVRQLEDHGFEGDAWIQLDRRNPMFHLPKNLPEGFRLADFQYDTNRGIFTAVLHAPADAPVLVTAISGKVERVVSVPVLKRRVEPGDVIRKEDIGWLKLRERQVKRTILTSADSLIGQTPRRPFAAGKPVRRSDVEAQRLVEKGKLVRMIFRTSFMELTTRGRAIESGSNGDVVKVMNLKSKKVVEASVAGPGFVVINGTRQLSLNPLPPAAVAHNPPPPAKAKE